MKIGEVKNGLIKSNNWEVVLSKDSRNALILALQNPDCPEIFKRGVLYMGKKKVVLHLNASIRKRQICTTLINLDWNKVKGTLSSILSELKQSGPFEIQRFHNSRSVERLVPAMEPRKIAGNVQGSTSESVPSNISVMYDEHRRLQSELNLHIDEKKNISQQFLRVYDAFFGDSGCSNNINPVSCQRMANSMIEDLEVTDQEFERLKTNVADLEKSKKNLEVSLCKLQWAKQAIEADYEKLAQQLSADRRLQRRLNAERKPDRGWSKSARAWVGGK